MPEVPVAVFLFLRRKRFVLQGVLQNIIEIILRKFTFRLEKLQISDIFNTCTISLLMLQGIFNLVFMCNNRQYRSLKNGCSET